MKIGEIVNKINQHIGDSVEFHKAVGLCADGKKFYLMTLGTDSGDVSVSICDVGEKLIEELEELIDAIPTLNQSTDVSVHEWVDDIITSSGGFRFRESFWG